MVGEGMYGILRNGDIARRTGIIAGALVIGSVAVGAISSLLGGIEVNGAQSVRDAKAETTLDMVKLDPKFELQVAEGTIGAVTSVENVKQMVIITTPIPFVTGMVPPCSVNREFRAKIPTHYTLPFAAISSEQDPKDGATNFIINAGALKTVAALEKDAGVSFRDYTVNSGGKNFDDPSSECRSLFHEAIPKAAGAANFNAVDLAFRRMDTYLNNAIQDGTLQKAEMCTPRIADKLTDIIIKQTVPEFYKLATAQKGKLGTVIVTGTPGEITASGLTNSQPPANDGPVHGMIGRVRPEDLRIEATCNVTKVTGDQQNG